MKRILSCVITILTLLLFVSDIPHIKAYQTLDEIKELGTITLGTNAEYPPFEWVEIIDGESKIVGIDIDIATAIAESIGVELVIEDVAFTAVIDNLKTDRVDFAMSSLSITPERAEEVDFSDVYYETKNQFIVPIANIDQYKSLEDFAGKKVGVGLGSAQEQLAKEYLPDSEIITMHKNSDLVQAMLAGRLDAILFDSISGLGYVQQNVDRLGFVENVEIQDDYAGIAIAVNKGNSSLLDEINRVLAELEESGEMAEIIERNTELANE